MRTGLGLVLIVAVAACAAPSTRRSEVNEAQAAQEAERQREVALKTNTDRSKRLQDIASPLLRAAADLCGDDAGAEIGMLTHNRYSYPDEFRDAAVRLFGVGEALQVSHVVRGSAAYMAGMQAGDVLLTVNGKPVGTGKSAGNGLAKIAAELKPQMPVAIQVERAGESQVLDLMPERACRYPVLLQNDDMVNAFADGQRVIITTGMMRFTESDEELAVVIGHEIAHNAMNHMGKKTGNYMLGSIFDILAAAYGVNTQGAFGNMAAQAYSQDFEAEADYVGVYIMARANVPYENAGHFWRRMAAENPGAIGKSYNATHPSTSERFVALDNSVNEISSKRSSGVALMPEMK